MSTGPIVSVRGILQGASPETMDREVTSVVEGAVARVNGVREIRSSSEENNFRMRVEFDPGADLDLAAADVREAVSRVQRDLPDNVEQLAVVKADADASPILRLSVQGETVSDEDLARIVENDIVPELISVDGVADVTIFGDRERQLRVVLDPLRLSSYQLSATDVIDVLENAPFDIPAGSFGSEDQELIVRADARWRPRPRSRRSSSATTSASAMWPRCSSGPEEPESYVRVNGVHVIGLGIIRQAQSNTIDISKRVHQTVDALNARFERITVSVTSDDAQFIEGSVEEVLYTLFLAVLIVIATLWIFLGSPAATLIPCVSIPIALIGSVAAIWAARLLDQYPHPARPGAGDRLDRRRQHRGAGEHPAPACPVPRRTGGSGAGFAPGVLRRHRHHGHAGVGLRTDLLPAQHVRTVCSGSSASCSPSR